MLGGDEQVLNQDLLIFKLSPRVFVLLIGRICFRPGSFKNPPGGISPGCDTVVVLLRLSQEQCHQN